MASYENRAVALAVPIGEQSEMHVPVQPLSGRHLGWGLPRAAAVEAHMEYGATAEM